ncbi:interferon-induced protein 44-like [Dreissena polymorpha]|uniref:interferon-induced protein 44-like n=1 Tax=Dreissena polymorpha TaxID=45954 RepID=UPI0022644FB8|nr:interferon-induced protein 44-like [Dreissena polymorpha]
MAEHALICIVGLIEIPDTMAGQLPEKYMDQLESWIGTGPKTFTLLYKITRDGCNATTFHQMCDNQGPTVTVLYNQQGSVYGGYESASWTSSDDFREGILSWTRRDDFRNPNVRLTSSVNFGQNRYGLIDRKISEVRDIQDRNSFLFQLKYSGSDRFTMFSVCRPVYGWEGMSSYGPCFGEDLITFTGTVNQAEGLFFPLNGAMSIGNYSESHGLTGDQINNGNMYVTELEVYRVTDGQRKKKPTLPWRKTPEWNEKFLETLTEDIVSFKPSGKLGLSDIRILLLGPVGTGKSSFYNTIDSVLKGRISQRARCGNATHSITTAVRILKVRSGASLNFRLCDTRGLEVTQGLDILECSYLLDGSIPDYYEFNPATPICPDHPGFVHHPRVPEKIHCVLFAIDAKTVGDIPPKLVEKMNSFQKIMNHKGIPQAVLLTKVDLACHDVASKISNVFTSTKIEDAVDKVSGLLGLPRNNILPIKNYENEMQLDDNISILALLALRQVLYFAEDYIESIQEKMSALKLSSQRLTKGDVVQKSGDFVKE